MRLVDTLLAFPALLLALTISAVLGPNIQNTIIAIGVAFTPYLARIIRGEALRVAQMPYVEAPAPPAPPMSPFWPRRACPSLALAPSPRRPVGA